MVLLPTQVFTTHSIRLTVTRYFEFEGQISNSYQTAISLQIKIICRWAGEGIKEILQVNEIVKLREREGQRVDLGRSLKGHLWMVDGGWWYTFP